MYCVLLKANASRPAQFCETTWGQAPALIIARREKLCNFQISAPFFSAPFGTVPADSARFLRMNYRLFLNCRGFFVKKCAKTQKSNISKDLRKNRAVFPAGAHIYLEA